MKKSIDPKIKDAILKDAYSKMDAFASSGEKVDKYSVQLKNYIEGKEEVKKAFLRGRNTLTVEFEDDSKVGILLDTKAMYGSNNGEDYDFELPKNDASALLKSPINWFREWQLRRLPNTPGSKKALLFDPLYDDWPPESTTNSIENSLSSAGFTVEKMLGDQADLAHLETIESKNYGVIFIRSHGGILYVDSDDKIHIMVRPFFDLPPDPATSGYYGVEVFYLNTNWGPKYAYAFGEQFVRHHLAAARFPNTLLHLLVCHGGDPLGSDDLIDAFLDFGVGCYTGWTRNATLAHGDPAAVAFFEYLCGGFGRNINAAIDYIENLGHSPDSGSGAELVAYGSGSLALRGNLKIELKLNKKHLELLKKYPDHEIEILIDEDTMFKIPDWSPWGGMLKAVDRQGRRRFVPHRRITRIPDLQDAMQKSVNILEETH